VYDHLYNLFEEIKTRIVFATLISLYERGNTGCTKVTARLPHPKTAVQQSYVAHNERALHRVRVFGSCASGCDEVQFFVSCCVTFRYETRGCIRAQLLVSGQYWLFACFLLRNSTMASLSWYNAKNC
jgi:hypothetical protein